jgi:hypothetical protein
MKYWAKLKREDIIMQHVTVEGADFFAALTEACAALDLSKPVVCEKHRAEISKFARTVFYPDDFVEAVPFDTMEIEIITKKKKY